MAKLPIGIFLLKNREKVSKQTTKEINRPENKWNMTKVGDFDKSKQHFNIFNYLSGPSYSKTDWLNRRTNHHSVFCNQKFTSPFPLRVFCVLLTQLWTTRPLSICARLCITFAIFEQDLTKNFQMYSICSLHRMSPLIRSLTTSRMCLSLQIIQPVVVIYNRYIMG